MPLIVSKPMTAPHNNEKQKCLKATPWAFKESYQIGNRRRLKDGPKKDKIWRSRTSPAPTIDSTS